jgi:3-phosphoshikimate 1-carboxyvinyltransferase
MKIRPAKNLQGTLSLPGDKSISHRAAILATLAKGTTKIENFAPGADCASTLSCLKQLGVEVEREGGTVIIHGRGKNNLKEPAAELDCGNSGSTMRMLAGVLAGQNFTAILTGDGSLSARPMKRIIDPLTQMGAGVQADDNHAPLKIQGNSRLKAVSYTLPKPSAQLKSCVLLAGLFGDGETKVIEPVATRDHTERMLPHFGVEVRIRDESDGRHISLNGRGELRANDIKIPADISSAAFFMAAAAGIKNSALVLPGLGLNPTRTAIIDVLKNFGVNIEIADQKLFGREPAGDVIIRGAELRPRPGANIINGKLSAALIDEIPILAVLGTQLEGGLEIRDARELRLKESDRIKSVVQNLKLMGAEVTEFPDGLRVSRSNLVGARVDSYQDHRIAMAFAVAGLFAAGETEVSDAGCAGISFPGFFSALERIVK